MVLYCWYERGYNKVTTVKTAVSIKKGLFERAEALAQQMSMSRSSLYSLALENLMKRYENRLLLEQMNAVYADDTPDAEEQEALQQMRRYQKKMVEGEW
jgi:metal-responsive CopG/Arc/MetJ family transcriptional regulator